MRNVSKTIARDMLVSGEWLNSVQYDIIET